MGGNHGKKGLHWFHAELFFEQVEDCRVVIKAIFLVTQKNKKRNILFVIIVIVMSTDIAIFGIVPPLRNHATINNIKASTCTGRRLAIKHWSNVGTCDLLCWHYVFRGRTFPNVSRRTSKSLYITQKPGIVSQSKMFRLSRLEFHAIRQRSMPTSGFESRPLPVHRFNSKHVTIALWRELIYLKQWKTSS